MVQFKRGDLPTCFVFRPGRTNTVTTPKNIDQIHELILEDSRISAKSMAQNLGIPREQFGSIIYEDLDMWNLYSKWVPTCLNSDQKQKSQTSEKISNFLVAIQIISCHNCWQWTKLGYITMSRRQSNNKLSGGIATHLSPQKFLLQKSVAEILASIFWDQDGTLLIDYFPKGQIINAKCYSFMLVQLKDILKETPREIYKGFLVLARQCPCSQGSCNPEETGLPRFPVFCSPTLFSEFRPVGIPPVPWTEKANKSLHFSSGRELIAAAETWSEGQHSEVFVSGLQKLEQRVKKIIELRGEYIE